MKKKAVSKKTEKEFDAVQMMRRIREELSLRYWDNLPLERKELREARKKFKSVSRPKLKTSKPKVSHGK
jgi:hypothetical protein